MLSRSFLIVQLCLGFVPVIHAQFVGLFDAGPRFLLAKGQWRAQPSVAYVEFNDANRLLWVMEVEYAFHNYFSAFVFMPIERTRAFNDVTFSFGDLQMVADIKVIREKNFSSVIRVGAEFPTGRFNLTAPTGNGAIDFILENENFFRTDEWFGTTVLGTLIRRQHRNIKVGTEFTYQYEFGRRVAPRENLAFIFALAYRGLFIRPTKIDGIKFLETGRNVMFLGPIFAISRTGSPTTSYVLELDLPISERLFSPRALKQGFRILFITQFIF